MHHLLIKFSLSNMLYCVCCKVCVGFWNTMCCYTCKASVTRILFGCTQSLEGVEHSLVMDCSTWILKNNPEDALKLFITLDPPLPPALVLSHLKENEPHLQMCYLEQVMQHHPELNSLDLQNELVLTHLFLYMFFICWLFDSQEV